MGSTQNPKGRKMKKFIIAIAIAIASVMAVSFYEKVPEKIQEPEVIVETTQADLSEPWDKYGESVMDLMEELLPLVTDGHLYVVSQKMTVNEDGSILHEVIACDHTTGEEVYDSVEYHDGWELVNVNLGLTMMLEEYEEA